MVLVQRPVELVLITKQKQMQMLLHGIFCIKDHVHYLPPASEGWGKVLFSVCQSTLAGWGDTPSQVWPGGYPMGWGTPQTWDRVPPPPDLGWGTPLRPGMAVPPSDLGWCHPSSAGPGMGYTPGPGTGYPSQTWDWVPPWTWDGVLPPGPGTGYPPPRIAITCSGYAAGGIPLAFTQEDFLVFYFYIENVSNPDLQFLQRSFLSFLIK